MNLKTASGWRPSAPAGDSHGTRGINEEQGSAHRQMNRAVPTETLSLDSANKKKLVFVQEYCKYCRWVQANHCNEIRNHNNEERCVASQTLCLKREATDSSS